MSKPKCPNHQCTMDPTDVNTIWICPVSDARFSVDVDVGTQAKKIDKFGRLLTSFTITALDGSGG